MKLRLFIIRVMMIGGVLGFFLGDSLKITILAIVRIMGTI